MTQNMDEMKAVTLSVRDWTQVMSELDAFQQEFCVTERDHAECRELQRKIWAQVLA